MELNEVLAEKFFEKSRFSKIVSQVMLDQIIRHKNELKTVAKKALKANSQHTSEQVVFFVYTEIKIERLRWFSAIALLNKTSQKLDTVIINVSTSVEYPNCEIINILTLIGNESDLKKP